MTRAATYISLANRKNDLRQNLAKGLFAIRQLLPTYISQVPYRYDKFNFLKVA